MEGQSNGGWLSLGRRPEKCCHTGAEIAQHHAHDWPAIGESDGLIDPACYDLKAYVV